jgi:hypothetical protein
VVRGAFVEALCDVSAVRFVIEVIVCLPRVGVERKSRSLCMSRLWIALVVDASSLDGCARIDADGSLLRTTPE